MLLEEVSTAIPRLPIIDPQCEDPFGQKVPGILVEHKYFSMLDCTYMLNCTYTWTAPIVLHKYVGLHLWQTVHRPRLIEEADPLFKNYLQFT